MKRLKRVLCIVCAAALTAAMGFSAFGKEAETMHEPNYSPVPFDGTVTAVENGQMTMSRSFDWGTDELIVNLTEETMILDAVNGYPVPAENLNVGEPVRVYAGLTMSLSLPAITNGMVILCDVPQDAGFPVYSDVEKVTANADGTYLLSLLDGDTVTIDQTTRILPYLTRNIVRVDDLTPGTTVLLWKNEKNMQTAAKIVVFQKDDGYMMNEPQAEQGWKLTDAGWYFYENGNLKKGWLLDRGDWYYLNPETGRMHTGFITLNGKTYFLKEDGRMLKETHSFTVDKNGELHF